MQFQIHCAGSFTCELRCVAVARGMLRRFRRNNRLPQDTAMQRIRYERVFKTVSRRQTISCNYGVIVIDNHSDFYPRHAMLGQVLAVIVCPSVHPSVCHTPVLCQNS